MKKESKIEFCKECEGKKTGNYCSNCGRAQNLKRIDGKYIISEIGNVLNFNRGIFYTIKELLIRPGKNIQSFIHKDRNRLVKPIIFIIICSLIYTIIQFLFHFDDGYVNAGGFKESTVTDIFKWIKQNYGYANIIMSIFIAIWVKIFFNKYDYNFFELIILLCFLMGISMLIYTAFGIVESITNIKILQIGGLVGIFYASWAIGDFFDRSKKINYFKGLLSYLLGMITFFFLAVILGLGIDLI